MNPYMMPLILLVLVIAVWPAHALAAENVLRTLPTAAQKRIEQIRDDCIKQIVGHHGEEDTTTSGLEGDDGLVTFTVSGAQAVLVDELAFCGGECHHGINCATGYSHDIAIYIRSGKSWRKALSRGVTGETFLSIEPYTSKFRALVISVHGGDEGCPVRNKSDLTAWKKEWCDFTVKWDEKAKQFVYKPL